MTENTIQQNSEVTLHFSLKLEDGSVVDSNFENNPAIFTVGDGNLLPGFEDALIGLGEGDKQSFLMSPEQGFGQHNPNNIQIMPRDQFSEEISLEKGLMLSFADAQSAELPGVIIDFNDKEVTVDFNHPLAGKNIEFEVEILSVKTDSGSGVIEELESTK